MADLTNVDVFVPTDVLEARRDFFLFFSGVQGTGVTDIQKGGKMLRQDDVPKLNARTGVRLVRVGWFGSIRNVRGIDEAFNLVTLGNQYVPGDSRLVIYGHSAGAANALDLCRRFDKHNQRITTRRSAPNDDGSGHTVQVDLLVTVDAAAQEKTNQLDRSVAKCVARNLNFWQDNIWSVNGAAARLFDWSRGAPNVGSARIENIEVPGATHKTIDGMTWDRAVNEMQQTLSRT
ncbi:MAG: hypothetical protein R3C59_31025 [Planctomycetaceae bacterium]